MAGVMKVRDTHGHALYIVPAKIREVFIAMGNVVIEWDNGDKKTIETDNASEVLDAIVQALEEYYSK